MYFFYFCVLYNAGQFQFLPERLDLKVSQASFLSFFQILGVDFLCDKQKQFFTKSWIYPVAECWLNHSLTPAVKHLWESD